MRRSPVALLLAFLLLAAMPVLAGCLGASSEGPIRATAYSPLVETSPGRETSWAVFVNNTGTFRHDAEGVVTSGPPGWQFRVEPNATSLNGRNGTAVLVTAKVPEDATHGLHRITLRFGDARTELLANVKAPAPETAKAGTGARVLTAGFWTNGTLFYTNWKAVNDTPGLPRADEGPWNFDPLPVYVGGTPGTPPPEPYNASGYVNVIPGFDKALRGMKPGESKAVLLAPEDAYTRPGREDHFLFGHALHFVIHLVGVDELEPQPPEGPIPCVPPVCAPWGGVRTDPSLWDVR